MTDHTPAPWKASGIGSEGYIVHNDAPNARRHITIARVAGGKWEELKANARLIAAAPDMLDALKAVANDTTHPIKGDLQAKLRKTIDDAEGR